MTRAKGAPSHAPKVPGAPGPRASAVRRVECTADSAGGLTLDVHLPRELPATAAPALLLRLRTAEADGTETVRLPLSPVESEDAGETLRAALPSTMPLSEGDWDVHLSLTEGEARRPLCGELDLRSLVGRVPRADRTWLGVRIPYAGSGGLLRIRAWLRWPHAEVEDVRLESGELVLAGRLHGAGLGPGARLEARGADREEDVRAGRGKAVRAPVAPVDSADGESYGFAGALSCEELAASGGDRQLWLRPDESAEPVRLARILDDVADKSRGAGQLAVPEVGPVVPYFTVSGDLRVRPEP
ncbi:hypothetical protein [Streptomyces sulphureus]|uniref:hypothetical protein n=1 Tax=Streptomyces sulphureus TaxID=47758 RepID=UPI00037F04AD|nr:hypothetical protein [Streptomyces sulphureus]